MTEENQDIIVEEESGFSAPAHIASDDNLDCGCTLLPCPKLAKYATRPIFMTALCFIGIFQAAAHAYMYITSSTVSRRFSIDYYTMDWLLAISEITTFVAGLAVAYWGDRIHRATWTGALVLLQSVSYILLLIPQFTHLNKTIEEPIKSDARQMSMYSEDSPDICITEGSARIIAKSDDICYFTLFILGVTQFLSGLANVAYFALGISYLDDNTKRKNVIPFIGLLISMKLLGLFLGYLFAWSFLKIDTDNFNVVDTYRAQIGAWWIGWPILAILQAIPGLIIAIFPRRLLSEAVEEAANKILSASGTLPRTYNSPIKNVGSTTYLPSILRLLRNKILMLNVFGAAFCSMAIYNFILSENLFLESRFYTPRPTGILLGFNDPLTSRVITNSIKPLLISLVVIISGLVIARAKPRPIVLSGYNFVVVFLTGIIIFALTFDNCEKKTIVGDSSKTLSIFKYCNYDCRCTRDANFRPVCDNSGTFTFYSACFAGCTSTSVKGGVKFYDGCRCIQELTGQINSKASEGSCNTENCQPGWIIFELATILAYCLIASSLVGDLLINIRSTYIQDKALTIGLWLTVTAFFIQIPGKLIYEKIEVDTCMHWGYNRHKCHLNNDSYGSYICLTTATFLLIGAILKAVVCIFSKKLQLYEITDEEEEEPGTELQDIEKTQAEPLLDPQAELTTDNVAENEQVQEEPKPSLSQVEEHQVVQETPVKKVNHVESPETESRTDSFSKSLRPNSLYVSMAKSKDTVNDQETSSEDSNVFSKSPGSKISYKPLELDSDMESDLYSYGPRSRKRIPSKTDEEKYSSFPNPDNYEDPRHARGYKLMWNEDGAGSSMESTDAKFSKSTEISKSQADFNEIGIPVLESYGSLSNSERSYGKSQNPIVMRQTESPNKLADAKLVVKSMDEIRDSPGLEKTMHLLTHRLTRPPSRDQVSSGFGSLQNVSDCTDRQSHQRHSSKESLNSKSSGSTTESNSKSIAITTDL